MADLNSEVWDDNDYMLKDTQNLIFLEKNHQNLIKSFHFDFVDYRSGENLPCLPYFRVKIIFISHLL